MTLLDLLVPTPAPAPTQVQVEPARPQPKRRWARTPRGSERDERVRARALDDELRQRRAAWAKSLKPDQDELLGPWLPDGVQVVRDQGQKESDR